jgi:hypothetical protein
MVTMRTEPLEQRGESLTATRSLQPAQRIDPNARSTDPSDNWPVNAVISRLWLYPVAMAGQHVIPRDKKSLKQEILRLTAELRTQRDAAEALRREHHELVTKHRTDLVAARYRTIGEGLTQQIIARADAVIAEGLPQVASADMPASLPLQAAPSTDESLLVTTLQAQVIDLQTRLTDAQRTIEMLVIRVLEMSANLDITSAERGSRSNHPSARPREVERGAEIRTLHVPLTS